MTDANHSSYCSLFLFFFFFLFFFKRCVTFISFYILLPSLIATCKAGSYSPTGLEPCFFCEKGLYQPSEGQRLCSKCGANTTTPDEGANSSAQCGGTIFFSVEN